VLAAMSITAPSLPVKLRTLHVPTRSLGDSGMLVQRPRQLINSSFVLRRVLSALAQQLQDRRCRIARNASILLDALELRNLGPDGSPRARLAVLALLVALSLRLADKAHLEATSHQRPCHSTQSVLGDRALLLVLEQLQQVAGVRLDVLVE